MLRNSMGQPEISPRRVPRRRLRVILTLPRKLGLREGQSRKHGIANPRAHGPLRNSVREMSRCACWVRRRMGVLFVLAVSAVTVSCDSNHRDWKLKYGWVTNCVGPDFKKFAQDGAAGPGDDRPVFRINDQLVLAVPKKYWPGTQSIDHEPRTCTKISDLPAVRVIYFYVQGNWSAGYKTSDLPFGISGQRLQPDQVIVRVESKPARKLSAEDRKAAEENRREVERLWGEPREIAGLTCSVYCWRGHSGDSDFLQLKYQGLNRSFIKIYAEYWSPRYGGTNMHWETVTSDLSHWRDIDDEVWKLIADWNLLNNVEAQTERR